MVQTNSQFYVIKRDGRKENFDFNKVLKVIEFASRNLSDIDLQEYYNELQITLKVGITTKELQQRLISTANKLTVKDGNINPDYSIFANRLFLMDFWKEFKHNRENEYNCFTNEFGLFKTADDWIKHLEKYVNLGVYDERILKISKDTLRKLYTYAKKLNNEFDDGTLGCSHFMWNNFYYQTLKFYKSYLIKYEGKPIETFDETLLLISILGFYPDYKKDKNKFIENVKKFYNHLIRYHFIPATPQLLNLRRKNGNLSSCNIFDIHDNLESIMYTLTQVAYISKRAGGIGVYAGRLRPSGSYLMGNPGNSNHFNIWGKIFNDVIVAVNQGGLRKGSITIALPCWHKDVIEFISCKNPIGDQRLKLYDIFPQIILNDTFMKAVENNDDWYLVDHYEIQRIDSSINLIETTGKEFEENWRKVVKLIEEGKLKNYKKIKARQLLIEIGKNVTATGLPYIFFEDTANENSPYYEKIYCGNLCVTPDTKILTKEYGYIEISKIAGQKVHVWNGEEWSLSDVFKTGDNYDNWYEVEILDTTTNKIRKIICTDYHRWYVIKHDGTKEEEIWKRTFELEKGDWIVDFVFPDGTFGNQYVYNIRKLDNFVSDSYCFYEPKKNRGILNGVLTGNCMESFSPFKNTNPEHKKLHEGIKPEEQGYAHSCNLFSLNLPRLYEDGILFNKERLEDLMRLVIRYMDNIIEISNPPVIEIKNHNQFYRTIGIGFLGLADLFVKLSVDRNTLYTYRFTKRANGNEEVKEQLRDNLLSIIKEIFGPITFYGIKASVELAKDRGTPIKYEKTKWKDLILLGTIPIEEGFENSASAEFDINDPIEIAELRENLKKYGIRNTMLFNCPPNTSTSIYAGTTASIMPAYSPFQAESQRNATYFVFPKYIKYGPLLYDFITTYDEEDTYDLVDVISMIQKYIDSGISFEYPINHKKIQNIPRFFYNFIMKCWKSNIKTLYYARNITVQGVQEKDECIGCAN